MSEDIKIMYCDRIHDDTRALQHYLDGGKCVYEDGSDFPGAAGTVKVAEMLYEAGARKIYE